MKNQLLLMGGSVIGLISIYIYLKHFARSSKDYAYKKNLKDIRENECNLIQDKSGVLEYSREKSKELGFKQTGFKRPTTLRRKGECIKTAHHKEKAKISNKLYTNAIKNRIPLEYLYSKDTLKNKTLRVYVESTNGSKAVLRDNTAVKEIDLVKLYDIAGHFALVNIDKEGDEIKINYILNDD